MSSTDLESNNAQNFGVKIDENELIQVAEATKVLDNVNDYLNIELMHEFSEVLDSSEVSQDAAEAFIYLKNHLDEQQ